MSRADWIVITEGARGSGRGDVRFSVAPNTSATSRTGTLTIAGQTFTVTQAGFVGQNVEFEGTISGVSGACLIVSFTLLGLLVRTSPATVYRDGQCSGLRNGREIELRGTIQPDGSVLATRIEFTDDDRRGR